MRRIKLIVEFDGTHFAGLQTQAQGERTVQNTLEQALAQIPGAIPKVVAAGRTDAGVHALAMPFHYDTLDTIPPEKIPFALNGLLPPDLRALAAQEAPPGFHARKSCCWRAYRYRILNRKMPSPLLRHYAWWLPQNLNLVAMRHALEHLVGEHDFQAFAVKEKRPTVRQIYRAHLTVLTPDIAQDAKNEREIHLEFVGSGFLRGQVRSMVGTLVEIGLGKRDSQSVRELLKGGRRSQAGPTAPPQGLYFVGAGYTPWGAA
ncbi:MULTISPECIES: tRNA pseudouridine(38-40) synthase TruA [unclassified Meiothermus]|uniref:tRNA pseudouridine(38-40) synthase TruA n=1 Tax=unclassified Meiothermus TaxID=370471 RepID=UPI000D7C04B9|nr:MULTISPECIES: tRNA pseudouridine(38-40) synthase TruA [unclassified Meiothermus]PZA06802.1 tRNA pseudouridine(38-40) synthase TruA [Meiothermus sp. Pnk-1]RYM33638.1 tRNA pseudouridine(38-40) synthase TruA [Meiothermus sp. PNK-Is4]